MIRNVTSRVSLRVTLNQRPSTDSRPPKFCPPCIQSFQRALTGKVSVCLQNPISEARVGGAMSRSMNFPYVRLGSLIPSARFQDTFNAHVCQRSVQVRQAVLPIETAVLSLMLRLYRNNTRRPLLRDWVRSALLSPRLQSARSANGSSARTRR